MSSSERAKEEPRLPDGVLRVDSLGYRGKHYRIPVFATDCPVVITPTGRTDVAWPADSPVLRCLNTTWDLGQFLVPRRPVSLGVLGDDELRVFARPGAVRVLDLPIKLPDCGEYRVPARSRSSRR